MAKLLTIKHENFKEHMDKIFNDEQEITSLDIFDTFVTALNADTNLLSDEDLKVLVFKQFKEYGNFDETMQDIASSVSDIKQSTDDAITAIDKNDKGALKSAYTQLKQYQKKIFELEEDMYTDESTGLYNRKHLLNRELDPNKAFKNSGKLMHICVDNFASINKDHGHSAGDTVIKFVSKMLQKELQSLNVKLIRYVGVQFITLSSKEESDKIKEVFKKSVQLIQSKKFKTHSGEVLNIELKYSCVPFSKEQSFNNIYSEI